MSEIINCHPTGNHKLAISLSSEDQLTDSGKKHRCLAERNYDVFLEYMLPVLQTHHIDNDRLEQKKQNIKALKLLKKEHPNDYYTPYPRLIETQCGDFAEIFLAEYLRETTTAKLPIYRLRHNSNQNQSLKGDDVLLFDLDSDPVRIIVGEAKFRGQPDKQAVLDAVNSLVKSKEAKLALSIQFVSDSLFAFGKREEAEKVQNCAFLIAIEKIEIDYVGFLMSNKNAANPVRKHTSGELHNLLMISLAMNDPEMVVEQSYARLEAAL